MANFLLTYRGGAMPATEAEQAQVMAEWTKWFGVLGDKLVDGGNPVSASRTIAANGSVSDGASEAPTGYSIIKADSLDAATQLAKGCPVLHGGASVVVSETFAAM
jgi:hypothetical protein